MLIFKKNIKLKRPMYLVTRDIAPLRKKDPGEKFPWKKLEKKRLGIWYKKSNYNLKKKIKKNLKLKFFNNLYKIGYRYFQKNKRSKNDTLIIKAFQRKYLPSTISGTIDEKTFIISHFLAQNANK